MAFNHYIRCGQELLRCGYTTGTCAALAAQGASALLLHGVMPDELSLCTPAGIEVSVEPYALQLNDDGSASCSVLKDAGDDPDVTDGVEIQVRVEKCADAGIFIEGGTGVGRVTKPGLDQHVGEAAINSTPRAMIEEQVALQARKANYTAGLSITVTVPGGEELAARTFNSQLGVEGGISILGTTGIEKPMSEEALLKTIELELTQARYVSDRVIIVPGNYGRAFVEAQGWDTYDIPMVAVSNFIGDALDMAVTLGFESVLLVGHGGKLVKLAGGIMNTHSKYGDCRRELICAHAAAAGAHANLCRQLLSAATVDACIELLDPAGLRTPVLEALMAAIADVTKRRVAGKLPVSVVMFSNHFGLLAQSGPVDDFFRKEAVQS